jgi:hypothetical protein
MNVSEIQLSFKVALQLAVPVLHTSLRAKLFTGDENLFF